MVRYTNDTGEKIPRSLWGLILEKAEKIPEEFISYYELTDILFGKYEMRPKRKNLTYTLVRIIYEEVDWKSFHERVELAFEEIWENFGYAKDKNFGQDLRTMLFNIVSKISKRRTFQHIYFNMVKLTAVNIYKSHSKLSYDEKVIVFRDFIKDFNKNSAKLIDNYTVEFKAELSFIKLMLGLNMLTVEEIDKKLKKADNLLGKNISKIRLDAYEEVIKKNDKYREEHNNKNDYRSIAINVARIKLELIHESEQIKFYKAFNKFKNENNITDYNTFIKKLSTIRSR